MKNIIFSILALLATTSLFAQKFEIGINGGIGYSTAPSVKNGAPMFSHSEKPSPMSGAAMLKLAFNSKNWRIGVEADYLKVSYKFAGGEGFHNPFHLTPYPEPVNTATLANPAIPVKLFVDRKAMFKNLACYAGISAGYVFIASGSIPIYGLSTEYPQNGNGLTAGIQAGSTYFITKHIGINAEVSANYMELNIGSATYKLIEIPATLGICYKL